MSARRIAYLADAGSIHTRRWVSHFARLGYETHVLTFSPGEIEGAAVSVFDAGPIRQEGGNWRYVLHWPAVHRRLVGLRPALVHAHYLTSYGLLAALSEIHPLVLSAWGSDVLVTPRGSWVYRLLLRFTLSRADLVTSDAQVLNEALVQYGLAPHRLLTLSLGVDSEVFHMRGREWPECGRRLISTRHLLPNTNLEVVLSALAQARRALPEYSLDVAGDGPERLHLEVLAGDLAVVWHGRVAHARLPELLRRADLYVALTLSDSTSVSLLEAMACGVFPIVSDLPANREWIEPGVNGLLVAPHDVDTLARAIVQVARDLDLRRRAAQYNAELIARRGDWRQNMAQVEHAYQMLIEEKDQT